MQADPNLLAFFATLVVLAVIAGKNRDRIVERMVELLAKIQFWK